MTIGKDFKGKSVLKSLILIAIMIIISSNLVESLSIDTETDDYKVSKNSKACGGVIIGDMNGTLRIIVEEEGMLKVSNDTRNFKEDYKFIPYMVDTTDQSTGSYEESIKIVDEKDSVEHHVKIRIANDYEMIFWESVGKARDNIMETIIIASITIFLITMAIFRRTRSRR